VTYTRKYAIWNVYNFFFHSKERIHKIKVWLKKSRTKIR
jgi:hypothetical protein